MPNFSGTFNLGNAIVNAVIGKSATYKFPLNVIPKEATVKSLPVTFSFTIIPSAAHLVNNSGGQGAVMLANDDIDAITGAIINSLDLRISQAFQSMSALNPLFMRTGFAYMRRQDFPQVGLGNGQNIPLAGKAVSLTIDLPVALEAYVDDLSLMAAGGLRFSGPAQLNFNWAALNAGGLFAGTFADGVTTFTIAPGTVAPVVAADMVDSGWGGGLVGSIWELYEYSGGKTTDNTQQGIHLGFWDMGPGLPAGAYTPNTYNAWAAGVPIAQNSAPADLINRFTRDGFLYGPNPTGRAIPILTYFPKTKAADINQSGSAINYQITGVPGGNLSLMELIAHPPNADEIAFVAKQVNGGNQVAAKRVVAKSMGGRYPSPAAAALLPVAIAPPSMAPADWYRMNPADVAAYVAGSIMGSKAAAALAGPTGKLGEARVAGR